MYKLEYNGQIIEYSLSDTNIHIKDSHKINNTTDMCQILYLIRHEAETLGFHYDRTSISWLNEWIAHNVLYNKNYKQDRTGSVDLNENEGKFKLFCYNIIAKIFR